MNSKNALRLLLVATLLLSGSALGQVFATGDVVLSAVASASPGEAYLKVLWFDAGGAYKGTLLSRGPYAPDQIVPSIELAFDSHGVLHATIDGRLTTLSASGAITATGDPTDFASGLAIAGDARTFTVDSTRIGEFSPALLQTRSFTLPVPSGAIDLAADQCTLYYGPVAAGSVQRFNVCSGLAAPLTSTTTPYRSWETLRILPNGELLVGAQSEMTRVDSSGVVLASYPDYRRAAIAPGGTSFWTTRGTALYRIDLSTGTILQGPIVVGQGVVTPILSLAVAGDPRAAFAAAALAVDAPTLSATSILLYLAVIAAAGLLTLRR